jgi:cation transport ATPase
MRCGEHLERAGTFDLVGFDKTDAPTKGDTTVVDIKGPGVADDELL